MGTWARTHMASYMNTLSCVYEWRTGGMAEYQQWIEQMQQAQ